MGNSVSLFWEIADTNGTGYSAVDPLPIVGSYKGLDKCFVKDSLFND